MDDRQLARILRKRNQKYVTHVGEDYFRPHIKMSSASKKNRYELEEEDEEIEGGFASLITSGIRAGISAARAAARATAAAAKAAAKAARDSARSAAKETRNIARSAMREIKNAPKNIRNANKYDKVRGVLSAAEIAYDVQSMARNGEPISNEIWKSLTPEQKVVVDIDKWQDELSDDLEKLFQSYGSNQAAAFLVIRVSNEGNPDDNTNKNMTNQFDHAVDIIETDEMDNCDPESEQACGTRLPNCYEYRNGGWEWQIGINSIKGKKATECEGDNFDSWDCKNYGQRDAYEARKACIAKKNEELRKEKEKMKEVLGFKKDDNVNFSTMSDEEKKAVELRHNALYFQRDPLTQKSAITTDFTIASGASPSLSLDDIYKAQAIASYMLLNEEFDYEDISKIKPFDDWIARDINMFPRALVQMSQPQMFLDTTPYKGTIELINKIGGGSDPKRITRAQQEAYNDMTASISPLLEQIDEAKDLVEERTYLATLDGAQAYDNTKKYKKDDLVKKDLLTYIYINDTETIGNAPPNPTYWEHLEAYSTDTMNQIEMIGNATLYVPSKKYKIGDYVAYMDETYVKIKDTPAGVLPTDATAWAKVDVLDPTAYATNKANYPNWNATTEYKVGNNVKSPGDNNYYTAIVDNKNKIPNKEPEIWRRIFMYTLTEEMKENIKINQRVATYQAAAESAKDYELGVLYDIGDIITGFDGNYYRLILQKKDASGNILTPPRPPSKFWELVTGGEKEYNDSTKYKLYDVVKYNSKEYILVKDTPAGTRPTASNIDVWKPVAAIFEDLDPDVRTSYIENQRQIDIDTSDDFTYDKEGYDEGDIVRINDAYGVETIYRCIKDYSIIWNKDTDYKVGDCAIYNKKLYKKIRQADIGMLPSNPLYWEPTSEEEVLKYFMTLAPPNPTYWENTNELSDDSEQLKLRRDALTWAVDPNPRGAKYVKDGDNVLDQDDDLYYKFSVEKDDNSNKYAVPLDTPYNTIGLVEPEQTPEGQYLMYYQTDEDTKNLQRFDKDNKIYGKYFRKYRWDLLEGAETTRDDTYTTFEQKNKWKPDQKYELGDYVYYKGYFFKVLKSTPAGILPMDREGNIRVDYYEWIERESEILAIKEAYDDKIQAEEAAKQEQAEIAWKPNGVYTDGSLVYHNGKYYVYNDIDANPDGRTNAPDDVNKTTDRYTDSLWMNADANGNVLPTDFNKIQVYPRDVIVTYNNRLYKMNNREKSPWYNDDGEFPQPPGAENINYYGSATPSDIDPTMWMEVYPDGKPMYQVSEDGKITNKNPAPTSVALAEATLGVEGEEDDNKNCPTATKTDDDETAEVKAKKALEKAMIEWVAKGSIPADDPRLLSGEPPVGTASGYTIDDLDGKKYYKNKVKTKVKRNRKNKI